jgi:hypothetical protein
MGRRFYLVRRSRDGLVEPFSATKPRRTPSRSATFDDHHARPCATQRAHAGGSIASIFAS